MGTFSVCEDAIDRLQDKLEPVWGAIPNLEHRPISYGFDGEDNPRLQFQSTDAIQAFKVAISNLDPESRLAAWFVNRRPTFLVHPKFSTAHS